jgi:imidazolonepropionase-like amidohydrolase
VQIISGVDSGIEPGKRHGLLPWAVQDLVDGGLSRAEALATATTLAANAIGLGDRKGRLAPGMDADLLLVDRSLPQDLAALRAPQAVWLHGKRVPD